jgi:hypothetical protein
MLQQLQTGYRGSRRCCHCRKEGTLLLLAHGLHSSAVQQLPLLQVLLLLHLQLLPVLLLRCCCFYLLLHGLLVPPAAVLKPQRTRGSA